MATDLHINDGTTFKVTIKDDGVLVDVSSSVDKRIYFRKPDGTIVNRVAGFFTDGTDGIISYVAASGHLDSTGRWQIQGFVKLGTETFNTDYSSFMVKANLI